MENLMNIEQDLINIIHKDLDCSRKCLCNDNCNLTDSELLLEFKIAKRYLSGKQYVDNTLHYPPNWVMTFVKGCEMTKDEESEIVTILNAIYYLMHGDEDNS